MKHAVCQHKSRACLHIFTAAFLKGLCGIVLALALSSCASQQEYVPPDGEHARIRVFHGTAVYLLLDGKCSTDRSKRFHAAAGGYAYLVPNRKIGMPPTDDLPFSYHEYRIPAGKQIAIVMSWSAGEQKVASARDRCNSMAYLTPKAGHDYDTFMKFKNGDCDVQVRELTMTPSGMASTKVLPPEALAHDPRCYEDD